MRSLTLYGRSMGSEIAASGETLLHKKHACLPVASPAIMTPDGLCEGMRRFRRIRLVAKAKKTIPITASIAIQPAASITLLSVTERLSLMARHRR